MAGNAGRAPKSVGGTTKKKGMMTVRTSKSGVRPATGGKNVNSRARRKTARSQAPTGMLRKGGLKGPGMDGAGGP